MEDSNIRGFVFRIEVGRAGLVQIEIIRDDGSLFVCFIEDIDGDPERFNERLSMLAILRDAMDRAEPVEVEVVQGERGPVLDRAARVTRDRLGAARGFTQAVGLVLQLAVFAANQASADGEQTDIARVLLFTSDLGVATLILDLQIPERLVAAQQLEILRDAEGTGRLVRVWVDTEGEKVGTGRIVAVALDDDAGAFGGERAGFVDGFVEAISLLPLALGGETGNVAAVRLTTAPPFVGAGNVTSLSPFTPVTIELLVHKRSPAYDLCLAGLRDNLRMRMQIVAPTGGGDTSPDGGDLTHIDPPRVAVRGVSEVAAVGGVRGQSLRMAIVVGAELQAHLASASRPVWISIARESLDRGPETLPAVPGLPSSDLTPLTLRDLRLPYPATWRGLGCFNPGVYRVQLQLPSPFRLLIDDRPVPLYPSDAAGIVFGHACLDGCHTVTVEIEAWTCGDEFIMDIYQLR